MNRQDFQQVKEIFHTVLELPADERTTYLNTHCSDNAEIRREIERLLTSFDSSYLENPIVGNLTEFLTASSFEIGQSVGHYKITKKLGVGGMGEVFLASHRELKRPAAIKVLPTAFVGDGERVRRFKFEARAVSALDHPNILTIFDIDEADGIPFIASEYVKGKTLRELIGQKPLKISEVTDISIQIASAQVAAHEAGIIHRDIKPENIIIRADSLVKVLDFGLAKLAGNKSDKEDWKDLTDGMTNSSPGIVMGTVAYMSPEQARGNQINEQTDIWSLGVVIYEMLIGKTPFEAPNTSDVIAHILTKEPLPVSLQRAAIPVEFDRIIAKALQKDCDKRYQTSKDLLNDLQNLKTDLGDSSVRFRPSRNSFFNYLTNYKRISPLFLVLLTFLTIVGLIYFNTSTSPVLTDKDVIIIADFENKTGDEIFDDSLKQGLSMQFRQSPFLSILSDDRVRDTLKFMKRSPDEKITREIAREICQRRGVKVFIAGTIAQLGNHYLLTLEAVNAETNEVLESELAEAKGKEQVISVLSKAATEMREQLGESLTSIEKFDTPFEMTTASLDALKMYSLARKESRKGNWTQAIQFCQKAIELDPEFASAYGMLSLMYDNNKQPELAVEPAIKAFELRDKVSEIEKIVIADYYHAFVTGDFDKRIELKQLQKALYPRDLTGSGHLAYIYNLTGEYEKCVDEANESIELGGTVGYLNLVRCLTALDRFAEAEMAGEKALQIGMDASDLYALLIQLRFAKSDNEAVEKTLNLFESKPFKYRAIATRGYIAIYNGKLKKGKEFLQDAVASAEQQKSKEYTVLFFAQEALDEAIFNKCGEINSFADKALSIERSDDVLQNTALAFAVCGNRVRTEAIVTEMTKKRPEGTLLNKLNIPLIKAVLELKKENASGAVELLRPVSGGLESASKFWVQYTRGSAYLKLNKGAEAAIEFKKILEHRGYTPLSSFYPLAHLGLARAFMQIGETEKAREEYQKFFEIWNDADADLPVLKEAKREFEKLNLKFNRTW